MNDKAKKPQKLRARLPRGLADRNAAELAATRRMTETIRAVYERYGFEPVETPAFEYTDALGKFLPDQDRPNEGVFSFQDDDEQWISLRYDLTAPLARYVAENWDALPKPYRSYRAGYVYRNEKPGPGRFRQFMQFDADTVGSASPAADAEMCMMAADAMEALGLKGQYVVKLSNRKVLDGVMEAIGLGGPHNAAIRLIVLRAIDKLDKFPVEEVRKLLGPGRWDGGEKEKGDFTKGAGLADDLINWILGVFGAGMVETAVISEAEAFQRSDVLRFSGEQTSWFAAPTFPAVLEGIRRLGRSLREAEYSNLAVFDEGVDELERIAAICVISGYGERQIRIDPSVVRGLEYVKN